jgi:tetratricopeptide (TPR) repeat protein
MPVIRHRLNKRIKPTDKKWSDLMMACVSKKLWYAFVAMIACYLFAVPCSYCSEVDQDRVSELRKQADKMKTEGYYSKAAALIEEVVAFKKQQSGTSSAELAEILDHLGELYCLAGKYAEAEPLLKESFSIRKEIFGQDHVETAKSYEHLSVMFNILGKYDQAENNLNKA